mgnify:CR=1 FL=1|tara:strand:- start:132 stop:464 length:333 start_codon:yes stop_codon:yes gene_type:complete
MQFSDTAKTPLKSSSDKLPVVVVAGLESVGKSSLLSALTGRVGEPRHGGIEATYVIFNTETQAVEIREVPYDVKATVRALKKSGLPESFAARLEQGEELAGKNKDITCAC